MNRKIAAVILGAVLALAVRLGTQLLAHAMYPSQPGADLNTTQGAKLYFETIPMPALVLILIGWGISTLAGAWFAGFIAKENSFTCAWIVALLVAIGSIVNFVNIPHPMWFMVVAILTIPIAAWIGGKLALGHATSV
jgi:hypothetical protein